MTKPLYIENQRLAGWGVPGLILFLMGSLSIKFIIQHWVHPVPQAFSFWTYLLLMIPLLLSLWYVMQLSLSIKVTKKGLRLQYNSILPRKYKIKWEEIESCEFIQTPSAAQWSGWNVRFHQKNFSLCGRTGIHLRTRDGEEYLIGTRNFQDFRNAVSQFLP